MAKTNLDEQRMILLASIIPCTKVRHATAEEDCGFRKADMAILYGGKQFYFQVSHTPKSKREQEKLLSRGTYPLATHKFEGFPIPQDVITENIRRVLVG